ncbi:complex I subunit 5 family protein [Thiosocius teredinicola]|uniref:complex I subunit 5 family protein n=1 Tax=Thiosocius teredinicola TaxID=1973002 RepID=UPI002FE481E1
MTDITLAVALPLLGAFLLPLLKEPALRWLGRLLGPVLLALTAVIIAFNWTALETPYVVALGNFAPPLGIAFYIDTMALLFALAVPITTLLLWPGINDEQAVRRESLTLLLVASLVGLALSGDLFNMYVFYELAAVASYGLAAGSGSSAGFVAAFRYLLISALGSVVALLGIGLIYFTTGTLNLAHLASLSDQLANPQGLAAFAMLVIGFGVKAELFPVNGWVPDLYAAASKRVSALLAGLASKLAVLVIVRVLLLVFPYEETRQLLLILGILGVISGELAALQARDVTRMLAWSSIGQLGVVFIAFSLPGEAGVVAGIVVALHHLVVKSALFLLADKWGGAIAALRGAGVRSKLAAGLFVLFALSLLGFPPLPGFWSKFLVLSGLAAAGDPLQLMAMAAVLIGTVIEGAYLLRVVVTLYSKPDSEAPPMKHSLANLASTGVFALALIGAALFVMPLWPPLSDMGKTAANTDAYIETVLADPEVKQP